MNNAMATASGAATSNAMTAASRVPKMSGAT
jgi:hypothetical protein